MFIIHRSIVFVLRLVMTYLAYTPLKFNLFMARTASDILFFCRFRRTKLMDNLDHVYGDTMSYKRKYEIAKRANRSLFMTFVEVLRAAHPKVNKFSHIVTYSEMEMMKDCYRDSRGTIFVVFHSSTVDYGISLWRELMTSQCWVVAKPLRGKAFNDFLIETRKNIGSYVISSKAPNAIEEINQVIRDGHPICILPDQHAKDRGVTVNFLGRPASTFKGAAATYLENREYARAVVCVPTRIDDSERHIIYCREITDYEPTGDRERDVHDLTQKMCDIASEFIYENPESYLWHHGRWGRLRNKNGTFKTKEEREGELPPSRFLRETPVAE